MRDRERITTLKKCFHGHEWKNDATEKEQQMMDGGFPVNASITGLEVFFSSHLLTLVLDKQTLLC